MKSEDLQKHTLNLFAGDYQRLQELHPETGAAAAVRQIIRSYLNKNNPPIDHTKIKSNVNV